jgi:TonB family protein
MVKTVILMFVVLGSVAAAQVEKRTCDHPAPPQGMYYVCDPKDTCDCHLEKNSEEQSPVGSEIGGAEPCSATKVRFFVAPAYPLSARAAKKQDTVKAHLTVDGSGTAQIKIESGEPIFAEAVTSALNKWRFEPTEQPRTLDATFTFAIAGDATDAMRTTVAGSSPLHLVISVSPPIH